MNLTNIKIEDNKYINIQSHGSVFTGSGTDLFGIDVLALKSEGLLKELYHPKVFESLELNDKDKLWYLFLLNKRNHELKIGCRNANGEPLQPSLAGYLSNSDHDFQNFINSKKILDDREYGMLIGVFADGEADVVELLKLPSDKRKKHFFPVGKSTEIITDCDGKANIKNSFFEGMRTYEDKEYLYLLVNDSLLIEGDQFYNGKNKMLVANQRIEETIYNKFKALDLWFMDNLGYFLTTFKVGTN